MVLSNKRINSDGRNKNVSRDKWKWEPINPIFKQHSESSSRTESRNIIVLNHKTRKISNKQSNLTPKGTRKRTTKPKVSKTK